MSICIRTLEKLLQSNHLLNCLFSVCPADADCLNTDGSFFCECRDGFHMRGGNCIDVNECQGAAHNCSAFADCHNDHGIYYCTCWDGYLSPLGDGYTCENIDECKMGAHGCPIFSSCVDNDGSFVCKCNDGYSKFTDDGTNS